MLMETVIPTRQLSAELLTKLELRSSIVRDQEQRKVRACIPCNLTNFNADTSPGRRRGGEGGLHTTIQNKSCCRLPDTTFLPSFFVVVGGGGLDSFMSVMLHTNSFCELLHSSYGNSSQKEA